jgi:hypothetical protein
MKHWLVGIAALCLPAVAQAEEEPSPYARQAIAPMVSSMSDSESFSVRRVGAGYYPWYDHGDHFIGVKVLQQRFAQDDWEENGMQYSLSLRNISPRTGMGYYADVGISTQGDHDLLTIDSDWSHRLTERTAVGAFVSRDWVESQNALENGVSHTFAGGSIEHKLAERWTAIGVVGGQYFSDGNMRPHGRARVIYDLWPEQGITLQGRYRIYSSTEDDVNGRYFNPEDYSEEMIALGIRQRVAGWMLSGTLGIGKEHVDSNPSATTRLALIEATSPIAGNVFWRTRGGYNESAGFNGPNYNAYTLQTELVFAY